MTLKLKIDNVAFGGKGVARHEGKVYFVEKAVPGDEIEAEITHDHSKYSEARIKIFISKSDLRTEIPKCPHYQVCGGCDWQDISYEKQLEWKKFFVTSQITRAVPKEIELPVVQIHASENKYHYRNRIFLRARFSSEKISLGYFEKGTRNFIPITQCPISAKSIDQTIKKIVSTNWPLSDEDHSLRFEIQEFPLLEHKTSIILHPENQTEKEILFCEKIRNELRTWENIIFCELQNQNLKKFDFTQVQNVKLQTQPSLFQQVNLEMNKKIHALICTLIEQLKPRHVLDLFCGSGNFSLPYATKFETVIGIEGSRPAIKLAIEQSQFLKLQNVQYIAAQADSYLKKLLEQKFDFVITDPPREGMKECIPSLLKIKPTVILYISCDPATLARDLNALSSLYEIQKIDAFDMFPQTYHVETVCLLRLKEIR